MKQLYIETETSKSSNVGNPTTNPIYFGQKSIRNTVLITPFAESFPRLIGRQPAPMTRSAGGGGFEGSGENLCKGPPGRTRGQGAKSFPEHPPDLNPGNFGTIAPDRATRTIHFLTTKHTFDQRSLSLPKGNTINTEFHFLNHNKYQIIYSQLNFLLS